MTEIVLAVAIAALLVERFYAERNHSVERRRLVNQLMAGSVSELVALESIEPALRRRSRKDRPTPDEPAPSQIGL